jgi:hypothetical protein
MSPESHTLARVANGAIGALVGVYAFLDDLILGPILIAVTVFRLHRVLGRLRRHLHRCRRCDREPRAHHLARLHPEASLVGEISLRRVFAYRCVACPGIDASAVNADLAILTLGGAVRSAGRANQSTTAIQPGGLKTALPVNWPRKSSRAPLRCLHRISQPLVVARSRCESELA